MSAAPLRNIIAESEADPNAVVVHPLKEREGRCFEFAFLSLIETWDAGIHDVTLVHGVITGYHRDRVEAGHELRLAHAWLERGDIVYEATADFIFRLDEFYREVDAVAERRYSAKEAMFNRIVFSTVGPWHKTVGVFT